MSKVKTGLLVHFVDLANLNEVLKHHADLKTEVLKFRPTTKIRKAYLKAYNKFLNHKNKLNLVDYGFEARTLSSEAFGTKTFYDSKINFFWAELFEAVHLKLI